MQRDLRAALEQFVATHRGLRLGSVFGLPAGFAGRRVFARLSRGTLELRLPRSAAERSRRPGSRRASRQPLRRTVRSDWFKVTPTGPDAARLEILLEQAARYVALA